jgi:hypothetical protein
MANRQMVLKPQDLVVALKIAVNRDRSMSYSRLGAELEISASEAHSSVSRCLAAGLLSRISGSTEAAGGALEEFILHGVRYCFPPTFGAVAVGIPTGVSGQALRENFSSEGTPYVWPFANGSVRGLALLPLYPSVPRAAENDERLYDALTLVDAIRAGAARERELAAIELRRSLL